MSFFSFLPSGVYAPTGMIGYMFSDFTKSSICFAYHSTFLQSGPTLILSLLTCNMYCNYAQCIFISETCK